jgi:hypothetical protein
MLLNTSLQHTGSFNGKKYRRRLQMKIETNMFKRVTVGTSMTALRYHGDRICCPVLYASVLLVSPLRSFFCVLQDTQKLVRTTPHKLLVQFYSNFTRMISTKSSCALSVCLSVCQKT